MLNITFYRMHVDWMLCVSRGCLFYGPPGTGKTLVARALANECSQGERKVAFFMRKGADCLSKWVGESERQLRLLFDQVATFKRNLKGSYDAVFRDVIVHVSRIDPYKKTTIVGWLLHDDWNRANGYYLNKWLKDCFLKHHGLNGPGSAARVRDTICRTVQMIQSGKREQNRRWNVLLIRCNAGTLIIIKFYILYYNMLQYFIIIYYIVIMIKCCFKFFTGQYYLFLQYKIYLLMC